MAETIDKVQLEVTATANGATQVVNNLVSSLKTLQSALSSLDTSKLTKATQSVNKTSVNTSGMSKAEKDISSSVNKIKQALAGLESYKNAALSGDSSSLTSFNRRVISIQSSIDTLKEKFSQLGNTSVPTTAFSNLDTQIEATKSKLEELKAKEESMSSSGTSVGDMTSVQTDIQNTEAELEKLIAKQQDLINSGDAYTDPLASYRDSIDEVQQSLSNAKSEVDAFSNSQPSVDLSGLSSGLSDVSDKAKDAASQLWSMTKSGIKSGFSSLKSSLSKIKDTLTSIGTKASNTASTGFSKILKYGFGIRSMYVLFRRLRTAVKDSFTELQNSGAYYQTTKANVEALKNSLTTLKYQFGAAFEPIFNTVAPALQTLINYLVTVMNTISAFIAKLTGKSTYSKAVVATSEIASNTGSAASSAAELNKQLQGFDELNNLDLDSGSSGSGGSGSSSDSSDVTYVEESVESALGTFANDLIDKINDGDWEGVGNALSSKLTDALNSIDWDEIKTKASNFGTNLASFFNGFITTDLFSAIGTTLAESLNTAFTFLNSFGTTFDWTNFGNSIGTGINSFFEDADFSLWGDTVHTWVAGILDAGIALLETTDFTLIGSKLGDFFESLQVSDLLSKVKTLCKRLITAIAQTITGFKNSTSEKTQLETAIGTLIGVLAITKSVPLTLTFAAVIGGIEIGGKLYEVLSGNSVNQSFLEELTDICDGLFGENKIDFNIASAIKFVWEDLTGQHSNDSTGIVGFSRAGFTTAISTMINPYLTGALVWIDLGEYIQFKWTNMATSVGNLFSDLADTISSIWNGQTYSQAGKGGNGMTSSVAEKLTYSEGLKSKLTELGKNIWEGIKTGFENSISWVSPVLSLFDKIVTAIKDKFDIHSPAKTMYEYGKDIFLGIIEGFLNEMTNYGWDDLASDLSDLFNGTSTTKTGSTAQGNFNRSTDKTHSKTGGNSTTYTINTKLTGEAKNKTDLDNLKTSFSNLTTESSKSTESEYKTKVGGQINSIDDLTTWKTKFKNLWNTWVGKSATLKALEDGIANNKVQGWINSFNDLKKKWLGKDAKLTTSEDGLNNGKVAGWVKTLGEKATEWIGKSSTATFSTVESGLNNFDGDNGYKARLADIQSIWQGQGQNRTATFTTNTAGNLNTASSMNEYASASQNIYEHFHGGSYSAGYSVSYSGMSEGEINNYAAASGNLWNNWHSGAYSTSYSVSGSVDTSSLDNFSSILADKIKKAAKKVSLSVNVTAKGGIISASGALSNIPQFAGGTLNAGSVFIAGERGPEVMGHINGRTEILNRSQMASIMNNSFVNAMAQFGNRMLTSPETVAYKASGYQSYNPGSNSSNDNLLLAEQNQLLREQNELLSQLLDKPTGVSSRDVFNAVRSESSSYYNRTGNSPFLF